MAESDDRLHHPLLELTLARIREFYREPGAVFWVFVFPVLLAIGLGIAFRARPPDKPRVVVEQTEDADWVHAALQGADSIELSQLPAAAARRQLRTGRVDLVVAAVPGERAVRYRYDPTRKGARAAQLLVDRSLQRALGRRDVVAVTEETHTEPGGRYIDFLLPGLIGLNLMGSSMWGIGYAVVWDRRHRLLKRFAATPLRRSHYLLAFMLSRLVFMLAELVALTTFGFLVFGVKVHGSIPGLFAIAFLGAATFAGISLLVAARVQSMEAASGLMNFVQLPMYLLSGAFFSYARFPEVVQPAIRALPLTALNDALRAVINDGAAVWTTWPQLLVLLAWGGISFVVALKIFRWQ